MYYRYGDEYYNQNRTKWKKVMTRDLAGNYPSCKKNQAALCDSVEVSQPKKKTKKERQVSL